MRFGFAPKSVGTASSTGKASTNTDAALPFFDALTTWGAVVATYMVAKKLIENWIYWFVIDFISVFLFLSRDLFLTALLFVGYLVIIIFGYIHSTWKFPGQGLNL